MALDTKPFLALPPSFASRAVSSKAEGMEGSAILAIAATIKARKAAGETIGDFTVGDFDPKVFPVPPHFVERVTQHYRAGETNYPGAIGIPRLQDGIRAYYERELGLVYPAGSVQTGAGARPPIYAAFHTLVAPGDLIVYGVPSWNVGYYAYLCDARSAVLLTKPEDGFLPTVDELLPHLHEARLLVLNSPSNPAGTVLGEAQLREICEAIVVENRRREEAGERPLYLLYDQVYWKLTYGDAVHHTPPALVPEMARWTVLVDAISKSWAATGVRVGWCVCPPWLREKMTPLVGHMGAWAGRAEQAATADLLEDPRLVDDWLATFRGQLQERLVTLADGIHGMKADGLPIDCLEPQGAMYLTARADLHGRTVAGARIGTDDDMRAALLSQAGVAVVPFTAFGYPEGSGWFRLAVGAVTMEEVDGALERLRSFLASV